MDHGPSTDWGEDRAARRKASLGLWLFAVYCLVYSGFVVINTLSPKMMEMHVLFGLNLAVVYGFGLILLAIVMGLAYNALCTKAEDELNAPAEGSTP